MKPGSRFGLRKTSLIDYPGEVAAVFFTAGCNLRCPYCHNPELVTGYEPSEFIGFDDALVFLRSRQRLISAIVISGGEPLLHDRVVDLANAARSLGLLVKLDTNGSRPDRIAAVGADYVALDVKLPPRRYHELGSPPVDIERSIHAVRAAAPRYEFRTTYVPGMVNDDDIRSITALMKPGEAYTVTAFRPGKTLDARLDSSPAPTQEDIERARAIAMEAGLRVTVRDHRITYRSTGDRRVRWNS